MTHYPLVEILFFIANLLAPAEANLIFIQGPEVSLTYSRSASGWKQDSSTWTTKDATVLVSKEGESSTSTNVEEFVKPLLAGSWDKKSPLKLGEMTILEKKDSGFVLKTNAGDPTEKQYRIQFGIKSEQAPRTE